MALTGKKAQRDGWQYQAEHLAHTHTAVMAAAEHARDRRLSKPVSCHLRAHDADRDGGLETSHIELANERELRRAKPTGREEQVGREAAAAWILNARRETLAARAARAATADKRVAELEVELAAAREALVLRDNENHSLQTSLDLIVSENARLSSRLTESDAAVDKARSQLEQAKTALTATEAKRSKLAFAVDEANEKRQTEANSLNIRLAAMSARAVTAEKLLAEARQNLLARNVENSSAERKLADATVARNAADLQLELLQNALEVKERQVQDLEQSRSELIEGANTRDAALARAKEKIKLLAELAAQIEAKANLAESQKKIVQLNSQPQNVRMEGVAAEGARKKAQTNGTVLQRELDNDEWLLAGSHTFLKAV